MKVHHILPLASFATAFVLPDAQIFEHLAVEPRQKQTAVQGSWEGIKQSASDLKDNARSTLDSVIEKAQHIESNVETSAHDALSWSKSRAQDAWDVLDPLTRDSRTRPFRHPHGPPPPDDDHHDGPPHHGRPPCHPKPPHHGPHEPSNKTIYQLISESKYTTKLAKLIDDFPDIVEKLNSTDANSTIFAPTDKAFDKIPEHAHKPSKETLEKILQYHISADFYPAGRVLNTHTIPTLLKGHHLSSEPRPQRLSINFGLKGLTVNFYSRIVAVGIFGSNGVIHGVDHLLLPPPNVIEIIDLLPGEFSTLELALTKTGLLDELNSTNHPGGTFFAPSNLAFQKLGPKINMFLFSKHGQKYLKALLLYHVATGTTLYSDAAYVADHKDDSMTPSFDLNSEFAFLNEKEPIIKNLGSNYKREARRLFNHEDFERQTSQKAKRALVVLGGGEHGPDHPDHDHPHPPHHGKPHVPKGYHHYDLPTMLGDQKLNVDVARYGPFIGMKVNGFSRVVIQDGIAQDGVIQVVSDVLIPPHGDRMARNRSGRPRGGRRGGKGNKGMLAGLTDNIGRLPVRKIKSFFGLGKDRQMSLCEFKARFRGLVEED